MEVKVRLVVEGKQDALRDLREIEGATARAAVQVERLVAAEVAAWGGHASAERIHAAVGIAREPENEQWRIELLDRHGNVARGFVVDEKPTISEEDGLMAIAAGELAIRVNPREFPILVVEQNHAPATSE